MIWPFSRLQQKNVYKCSYIPCAEVDPDEGTVTLRLRNMREAYVEANDVIEAQVELAKTVGMMSPHFYVDRITEVISRRKAGGRAV